MKQRGPGRADEPAGALLGRPGAARVVGSALPRTGHVLAAGGACGASRCDRGPVHGVLLSGHQRRALRPGDVEAQRRIQSGDPLRGLRDPERLGDSVDRA